MASQTCMCKARINHSDQRVRYAAADYTEALQVGSIQISIVAIGVHTQNGYAKRLNRTICEEAIDLSEYRDYHNARDQIGRFLDDVYVHKRIHSSLGYLIPVEFENQCLAKQILCPI